MRKIPKKFKPKLLYILADLKTIKKIKISDSDTLYYHGGRPGIIAMKGPWGNILGYKTLEETKNHYLNDLRDEIKGLQKIINRIENAKEET